MTALPARFCAFVAETRRSLARLKFPCLGDKRNSLAVRGPDRRERRDNVITLDRPIDDQADLATAPRTVGQMLAVRTERRRNGASNLPKGGIFGSVDSHEDSVATLAVVGNPTISRIGDPEGAG